MHTIDKCEQCTYQELIHLKQFIEVFSINFTYQFLDPFPKKAPLCFICATHMQIECAVVI